MSNTQSTTKTMFALRRVSDGVWIDSSQYGSVKIATHPNVLGRLVTAKAHRKRVHATHPDFGVIEICNVVVSTSVQDLVAEDMSIQSLLVAIASSFEKHVNPYGKIEVLTHVEKLLSVHTELNMGYLVVVGKGTVRPPTITEAMVAKMRTVAIFKRKGDIFLVRDHTSLSMLMLCEGFIPTLIFDLHAKKIIQGGMP